MNLGENEYLDLIKQSATKPNFVNNLGNRIKKVTIVNEGDSIKVTPKGWIDKQIWREINDILRLHKFSWLSNGNDSCWLKMFAKIRERFNTYNFADYKEHVISLLKKVTTVSLKTMELREELEKMEWGSQSDLGFKVENKAEIITEKPKVKKSRKKKTTDYIQKLDTV